MAKQTTSPAPKKSSAKVQTPLVLTPLIPDGIAKKIFIGLSLLIVLGMAFLSKDYGITGDENFHRVYGHHVANFYTSLGEDITSTQPYGNPDSLMRYYGGFFDGSAALLHKAVPTVNEWTLRHFWNSLFGASAIVLAGVVAAQIAGWQAGLITLLFMLFSPRFFGEGMNNPKDITMATGYLLSYVFIIQFLKNLAQPSLKIALGLALAIGIALGIRIGGLLLIPYFLLFYFFALWQRDGLSTLFDFSKFKDNIWPSFKYVLVACVLGYAIGMFFWPYGLLSPITNPLETLSVSSKFPAQIRMLFNGEMISSTDIKWNYIPKWLLITTPLFGLIGLIGAAFIIPAYKRQGKLLFLGFVIFTLVFPVFYVIYKKAVLYDGMRHLYFVYPSIIILAGLAFDYFINSSSKNIKYAVAGLAFVLMLLPARFMFANHPNQAVYFNEIVGGIKGAYGNFETDYYMNSLKQCADWIKQNENVKRTNGRKTLIYSNGVSPITHYFSDDTANVSVGYVSYRNRMSVNGDYLIFYQRFVDRELLVNGCFPPEQAIHTVYADGVPIACVIKKTDRSDLMAMEAMQRNDFETAVQLLEPYCAKYPKADAALTNLGLAYLQSARQDPTRVQKALNVLTTSYNLNKENQNAIYYLAYAYEMSGNSTQAQYLRSMLQQ